MDEPTPTPEVFISLTQAIPATPIVQASPVTSTSVTFGRLTLEIPSSVANGASGLDVPPVTDDDAPDWEKTPGHLQVSLGDYYILQGKFHEPRIYVYPALEYGLLVPGAFESMHRLRNVMNAPGAAGIEQLPAVPFFNAAQAFASNFQTVSFQKGEGVLFLTEYAQYAAPVNNHELFYHFQGFTSDGGITSSRSSRSRSQCWRKPVTREQSSRPVGSSIPPLTMPTPISRDTTPLSRTC